MESNRDNSQGEQKPKEFKTMEIHAKPTPSFQPANVPVYQPMPYFQQYYNPTMMMLMSILNNEGNKKFYQNEVMQIKMTKLDSYGDYGKIKLLFRSCEEMNEPRFNTAKLNDAEFFVLRSTCDDDIHKVSQPGDQVRLLDLDPRHQPRAQRHLPQLPEAGRAALHNFQVGSSAS